MASDWQNPVLRCDVDSSAAVTVFDALLIVNSLERSGPRELLSREAGSTEPFYDVSGDQAISPLDVLVVINAIGRSGRELSIAVGMNAPSDPNSNGVVLSDTVAIGGQTAAYASVKLTGDQFPAEPNDAWSKRLGASGEFSFNIPLEMGVNRIEVTVLDEMGREHSVHREVRRGDIVTDWNAAALNVVRE